MNRLESDRLDIFDGSGRLIGQLRDPEHPSADLRVVRAGIAYFVTADSLVVESVRAFRIGKGGG